MIPLSLNVIGLFEFSLCAFFFLYLWKYSTAAKFLKVRVDSLGGKVEYLSNCCFCMTFWACLTCLAFGLIPYTWLFCTPVLTLFYDMAFKKLAAEW